MTELQQHTSTILTEISPDLRERLRQIPLLASLNDAAMACLEGAQLVRYADGEMVMRQGDMVKQFWILLSGSIQVLQARPDLHDKLTLHEMMLYAVEPGASFGEVPLLASIPSPISMRSAGVCEGLVLNEEQFWALMNGCPEVRKKILGNMAIRLEKMQSATFQQEKMASLGTMAAGLMHELNNPGAAARRAASHLRQNLLRLHALSARFSQTTMTVEQKQCLFALQKRALEAKEHVALSSLEQSDAEEALAGWMEDAHVENAWAMAPALVGVGIGSHDLECARWVLQGELFSDALGWIEALVSSLQLVGTVEESIGRVTDLVMAVKSYAYEGKGQRQAIDVNKSIHATLVILGHKLRAKEIVLEKEFAADLPTLQTECGSLNQVWTNLLDNAIDASAQHGRVKVRTWAERPPAAGKERTTLCIEIQDAGSGIPLASQPRIFDSFYTTKPVGVGTGLGLGIVHRIVEEFGGSIHFTSAPGETIFQVRLPVSR